MPIEPTLAELLETAHRSFLLDVHTCLPAVTRAYKASTQRGDFLPVVKGSVQDSDGGNVYELRPVIQNVPVRWERAGGYYSHKPLAAGDHGWLIFSEDCYAIWRATGEISEPGDLTRHSLSYPFFLPGAWPDDNPLPDAPTDHAVSVVQNFLRVSKAGSTSAALVALATIVDENFATLKTAYNTHTHNYNPGPGGPAPTLVPNAPLASFPSSACTSLKVD